MSDEGERAAEAWRVTMLTEHGRTKLARVQAGQPAEDHEPELGSSRCEGCGGFACCDASGEGVQVRWGYRGGHRGEQVYLDSIACLKAWAAKQAEPCIHPGVFARSWDVTGSTRHCGRCGRDVPVREL